MKYGSWIFWGLGILVFLSIGLTASRHDEEIRSEALSQGIEWGYSDGYREGYDDGYGEGYELGYENGYELGYEYGFKNGYEYGYETGCNDGLESSYYDGWHDCLESCPDALLGRFSTADIALWLYDVEGSVVFEFFDESEMRLWLEDHG